MGGSLDDSKQGLSGETEAPSVCVYILGYVVRPWLCVQLRKSVQHFPVCVVILVDRPWIVVLLRQEDKRSVGPKTARGRHVHGEHVGQLSDVSRIGKVVRINKGVYLIIGFEALGCVNAGENEFFVEEHTDEIIVRFALPCALFVQGLNLGPGNEQESASARATKFKSSYLVKGRYGWRVS